MALTLLHSRSKRIFKGILRAKYRRNALFLGWTEMMARAIDFLQISVDLEVSRF